MFNDTDKKLIAARCKQILLEHEEIIKAIVDDEVQQMNTSNSIKGTIEEIAKDAIFKEGKKEGMRHLLLKITQYAGRNSPQQEGAGQSIRKQGN